jgi:molybdate transport system substrate-binding protein
MKIAMDSIVEVFEIDTEIEVNLICNSSGMLFSQIEQGAPIDIYISANPAYTKALFINGKCNAPKAFARGSLYLATQKSISANSISEILYNDKVKRIGIPDFKVAPYGLTAKKYLDKINFYDTFYKKMILGESISQISQYLKTDAIQAGFISNSFMMKNDDTFNYLKIEVENLEDLEHCVTLIKRPEATSYDQAIQFINFISSQKSKDILSYFGYKPL